MSISMHDIATKCGVSAMTVSRSLNPAHHHLVNEQTRHKIMAFCERHNYGPNYSARTLAVRKTFSIGLIQPWVKQIGASHTYGLMLKYFVDELRTYDYTISLLPLNTDSPDSVDREVVKAIRTGRVDGFISLTGFIGKTALDEMSKRKFAIVTFNMPSDPVQEIDDFRHVRIDSRPAVATLFEHLHQLGHDRIAFAGYSNSCLQRLNLYREFLPNESDLLLVPSDRKSIDKSLLHGYKLVFDMWPRLKKYTAVTCINDAFAIGLCQGLKDKGMIPGKDIAVAGFDDLESGETSAFLTTVHPPLKKAAKKCIESFLSQIRAKQIASNTATTVDAKLIIRESTADSARG